MAELEIFAATKCYGEIRALDDISLSIRDGEFVALLGPSGCGKTTLLRLVAGFERLDRGEIRIGQRLVSSPEQHVDTEKRNVGVVFQSYALWPHMSVRKNVGYPLKVAKIDKTEREERIDEALDTVGLRGLGSRRPADLSGGQRQRVALARCLVMQPEVVLLDEPLANLDVHLREAMLQEFREFHAKTGATMVFVTHDQSEAMAIADRIAVLEGGTLRQMATPRDLYERPASASIARFIGQGSVVPVTVLDTGQDTCTVRVWESEVRLRCVNGQAAGASAACIRSVGLALPGSRENVIACRVMRSLYLGGETLLELRPQAENNGADSLRLVLPGHDVRQRDDTVNITLLDGWVLPANSF